MIRLPAIMILFALASSPGAAQDGLSAAPAPPRTPVQPQTLMVGRVLDARTQRPLSAATITLRGAADSALVTGAVTRADGTFRVEGVAEGRYDLQVSRVGYATSSQRGITVSGTGRTEVPPIRLSASAVQLEGITATAERAAASLAADRNTYRADQISVGGGNAVDLLRNVPALDVDGDGNVSLRGSSNVAIQINGRAAPLRGEQLIRYLQQLPSGTIDRVEVIPNPSARYEPEGMSGIVNIVLKQSTNLGLSGGAMASAGTGGRYNGSGNLGYQQGRLTLLGSLGWSLEHGGTSNYAFRDNFGAGTLLQSGRGAIVQGGNNASGSGEWKLTPRSTLTMSSTYSARRYEDDSRGNYVQNAGGSELRYANRTVSAGHGSTIDASLAFRRVVRPQRSEFSAEIRFNRSADTLPIQFSRHDADNGPVTSLARRSAEPEYQTLAWQWDLTHGLTPGAKLETGYKGTRRGLESGYLAENFVHDNWMEDPGQTNSFDLAEQVHAGYAVVTHQAGKVNLQGGLRLEHTRTGFDLVTTGDSFESSYLSLFPSASAAYNLSPSRQLRASYSKRVRRPDERALNPFAFYDDPEHVWIGDPALLPEYAHAYELGFQESGSWGSVQVTPFYRHLANAIRPVRTAEGALTVSRWRNIASFDTYGVEFNGTLTPSPRFRAAGGFNVFRLAADGENGGESISARSLTWGARGNVTYKPTPRTDLQAMTSYRAPITGVQGRYAAMVQMSLSARQRLGEKTSIGLRLQDPFELARYRVTTESDEFSEVTERRWNGRVLWLSFNYSFGQAPRIRTPRPDAGGAQPSGEPM